jgi:hypothetical protein
MRVTSKLTVGDIVVLAILSVILTLTAAGSYIWVNMVVEAVTMEEMESK